MQEINNLTAETILSEEVICEVLEEADEVFKARLLLTLIDRAKDLGVKGKFEALVSAYKKEKAKFEKSNITKPLNQVEHDGVTHFDGEYPQMHCGMWTADENGIRMFTFMGERVACTHPILPIQVLTNAETGYVKVKLAFKIKGKWREIIVDNEVISSANKIVSVLSKYYIGVNSENAKAMVQYLSDIKSYNEHIISEQVSTSKLGWINNVFMPYGEGIIFDGDENFKSTFGSITSQGSYQKWIELVKIIRKGNRIEPKLYMAGAFASPLLQKLNALPFIINLYGITGKGKTVALMVATSVWANPEEGKYWIKANGSPVSLEIRLDFLNHFPLMVDDLSVIQKRLKDDFSEYVYNLCNGGGKDRATVNLGLQRQRYWKNVIITNSERSLVSETMQGGAINRIIEVEMDDGYIFPNGNEIVDIVKNNYGFSGEEFIEIIERIGFNKVKEIQQDFLSRIIDRAKELGVEKEEKQTLPMSIMLTADKIATDYIFEDGEYLDFNFCVDTLKNKGEVSENERAYEFILSEAAINMNKFKPDIMTGEYRGETWGTIEDGYLIIINNAFNKICERGNFSNKSFLSWAIKQNIIDTQSGKSTKTKRINGAVSRCIYLKLPSEGSIENSQIEIPEDFMKVPEDQQGELPFD